MPNKLDNLCLECPLSNCDEQSLWCLRSMLTRPNPKQLALFTEPDVQQKRQASLKKRAYDKAYRIANRDRLSAYKREWYERHKRLREKVA